MSRPAPPVFQAILDEVAARANDEPGPLPFMPLAVEIVGVGPGGGWGIRPAFMVRSEEEGSAKIFSFTVYPGKVQGKTAQVPNILESQDKFINTLGLTEYELYTLVREDGAWRVDQQLLVETPDVPTWFPKDPERPPS